MMMVVMDVYRLLLGPLFPTLPLGLVSPLIIFLPPFTLLLLRFFSFLFILTQNFLFVVVAHTGI